MGHAIYMERDRAKPITPCIICGCLSSNGEYCPDCEFKGEEMINETIARHEQPPIWCP